MNSKLLQQMLKSAKNAPVGKVGQIDLDCQFAVNHLASLYLEESVSYTGIASCRTCKNPPMTVSIPIIRLSNSLKPETLWNPSKIIWKAGAINARTNWKLNEYSMISFILR